MTCPNCGKEMEPGWVYANSVLFWSLKPDKLWKGVPDRKSVVLSSPNEYPAGHICKDCHTVILKY